MPTSLGGLEETGQVSSTTCTCESRVSLVLEVSRDRTLDSGIVYVISLQEENELLRSVTYVSVLLYLLTFSERNYVH